MKLRFKEGDFVIIKRNNHKHQFNIGETVMISIADSHDNGLHCCDVYSPGWRDNSYYSAFNKMGHCWSIGDCEIEKSTRGEFHKNERHNPHANNHFTGKDPSVLKNWHLR